MVKREHSRRQRALGIAYRGLSVGRKVTDSGTRGSREKVVKGIVIDQESKWRKKAPHRQELDYQSGSEKKNAR